MSAGLTSNQNTAPAFVERSPGLSIVALTFFAPAATILTGLVWLWPDSDPITPLGCLVLSLLFFGIHLLLCGRRLGAFDPGIWIPVLMILHYFGMVVAVELIPNSGYYTYDINNYGLPQVARGFATALIVLVLYLFGFHLLPTLDRNRAPNPTESADPVVAASALVLMLGGTVMMAVGIPIAGSAVLFGAYGEMKEAVKFALADFRLIGAGLLFVAGGTYGVLATIDRFRSTRFRLVVGCAIFVLTLLVLLGDRSGMSLVLFAGGWALTQRVTRIPRWIVIAGFCFMFLLMPIIKEYREYRNVEDSQTKTVVQLAAATLYEMGSSVQVYSYTIDGIPSEKDFNYGKSIVVQILGNLPNFAGSAGAKVLRFDPLEYDPSKWVTWRISPSKYFNSGGGFGFAVGAEWYFNFGFPGIFFGMIWMGWLTAFLRNRSRQGPMWLILSSLYVGLLIVVVRNDIGYPMRTMMWPLIGYAILNFIFRRTIISARRPADLGNPSGGELESPASYPGALADR